MAGKEALRLVVVTPEKTVLDEAVASLRFPLYDGDIGILPGRLPIIGRLGAGELRITRPDGTIASFFVDGGFVQVQNDVVTLLTERAMPLTALNAETARQSLATALATAARSLEELKLKENRTQRARRMLALAQRN